MPVIRLLSEPTMGLSKAGVGLTLAVGLTKISQLNIEKRKKIDSS